ncbi:cytochrome P450 [Nitzschia inconspicua]|uniref:Cytochrome P450 n=1 Tax=Nitzschia inconspicua TaxID=303405 RepID=A0A9K3L6V2_9STRA|nr:cytochrome P450 [Nitzschia inconspicua]
MSPCPAQSPVVGNECLDDLAVKSAVENIKGSATTFKEAHNSPRETSGFLANTFHWELNFYTFTFLAFVYHFLKEEYRWYLKVLFGLIAVDAARYYHMKGSMHGVPYTLPFVTIIAMLLQPERFWAEMANIAMSSPDGLCTNQLVGKFLIFSTDPKICRQILTGEGTYQIYAHPNAKWLFGEKNLIYLDKDPHKAVRKVLTPALFSNEALQNYAQCQEKIIRRYLENYAQQCQATGKPLDLRIAFRSMAAAASQESFMGPYLDDDLRAKLEHDILQFTMGFLSLPIPFAFGLKTALEAKHRIEVAVQTMVPKAKKYVAAGNEPRCMLERWALSILETAKEQGIAENEVFGCSDDDIGRTVLDFLFAAQDATNSALTYAADCLEAHPDVMEKMALEVKGTMGADAKDVYTKLFAETDNIPYTQKVSNQLLHHKPPVPMIPHLTLKPSYFYEHFIPQGAVVIPSLFYAARQSGSSTEFLPDREDQDSQFMKCMTFGGGQHKCPGRRYAEVQLTVFLALVANNYRFERIGERPHQDDFIYFPTLFPNRNEYIVKAIRS